VRRKRRQKVINLTKSVERFDDTVVGGRSVWNRLTYSNEQGARRKKQQQDQQGSSDSGGGGGGCGCNLIDSSFDGDSSFLHNVPRSDVT
jgi:hypothetical protein